MACEIEIGGEEVQIKNLVIKDEEIAGYLEEYDGENRCDAVIRALKVGVLSLKVTQTTVDVNYIDKAFDKLHKNFKDELEGYLGEDGSLEGLFDEEKKSSAISKISETVEKQLDPNTEGTALYNVKRSILQEFQDLKEKMGIAEAVDGVMEKTAIKGREFEEIVYEELDRIAATFEDNVEATGDIAGKVLKSKRGDIVITINPDHIGGLESRIVFEVKDRKVTLSGKSTIFNELEEAMENRDASIGIGVISSDYIPDAVGTFRRYPTDKILCSFDTDIGENLGLELAYKCARTEAISQLKTGAIKVDALLLKDLVKKAESKLDRVTSIKSTLTSVVKNIEKVKAEIDTLRNEVVEVLEEMDENLRAAEE